MPSSEELCFDIATMLSSNAIQQFCTPVLSKHTKLDYSALLLCGHLVSTMLQQIVETVVSIILGQFFWQACKLGRCDSWKHYWPTHWLTGAVVRRRNRAHLWKFHKMICCRFAFNKFIALLYLRTEWAEVQKAASARVCYFPSTILINPLVNVKHHDSTSTFWWDSVFAHNFQTDCGLFKLTHFQTFSSLAVPLSLTCIYTGCFLLVPPKN